MLVLFDSGTPRTLAGYLIDYHAVMPSKLQERGCRGRTPKTGISTSAMIMKTCDWVGREHLYLKFVTARCICSRV